MFLASSTIDSEAAQINRVIARASRRSLIVDALKYLAILACALLLLAIACFVFGTDVFPAALLYVTLLALVVVWAIVVYRARKPSSVVAQIIDHELALKDTLSTAHFLLSDPLRQAGPWTSLPVKQAAQFAAGLEPQKAFPMEGQRWWAVAAAMALLAVGLFVARYMVTQTLSLRPPLMSLALPPLLERLGQAVGVKEVKRPEIAKAGNDKAQSNANGKQEESAPQPPVAELPKPLPSADQGASQGRAQNASDSAKLKNGAQQTPSQGANQSSEQTAGQPSSDNNQSSKPANTPETSQQPAKNENASAGSKSDSQPSLMSRMKDALSNMMAKVSPQAAGQKSPNAGDPSGKNGQKGQQQSQGGEQQPGQQGKGEQAKSDSQDNANGQADGQTAEKAGNAQGRSGGDSQQKGNEAQSGVGKQDGDKALRDAEQQKAMGKLAEIVGKRSADLTGDMTVETPSGNQQLKTAYSQRQGKHADASGEINSNEVPLRYQPYVRQYMEMVRKSTPPPK